MTNRFGWLASIALGAVLWAIAALAAGDRELWDVATYWTIYLPAAYFLCFLLGFGFPDRTWRWPTAVMLVQLPVMFVASGEISSMAPVGAILLLVLSLPGMVAAAAGGAIRRWIAA